MPIPSSKGQKDLSTQSSAYNARAFQIRQEIIKLETTTVVRVQAVRVEGRVSEVGLVDVLPLVDQMDGQGNPVEHTVIYNVPFIRVQGGKNAVIVDPQVGDIGMCNFASRDITRVKRDKKAALPGSKRVMSFADGLYTGGILNGAPERYVIIDDDGIEIEGTATVTVHGDNTTINADTATINADTSVTINSPLTMITGILDVAGNILAKAGVLITGALSGAAAVAPVGTPNGIAVNGKTITDAHEHEAGTYVVGTSQVTGNSGEVT